MAVLSVTFVVDDAPPWKQTAADKAEGERMAKRKEACQAAARQAYDRVPIGGPFTVTIRYVRDRGRADGANIIGGVLDALEGILIQNDRQAARITYSEENGGRDRYQVTVTELAAGRE